MREKKKLAGGNKYVRSELNALWEAIEKKSVLMPLQGWAETSAGLIPPTAGGASIPCEPFAPTWKDLTGTGSVTFCANSWVFASDDDSSSTPAAEIPAIGWLRPEFVYIGSTKIDAGTPPTLGVSKSNVNYYWVETNWTTIINKLGDGSGGSVVIDLADTGGGHANSNHSHTAHVEAQNVTYILNRTSGFEPEIKHNTTGFPDDDESTLNVPLGKRELDSGGEVVAGSDTVWYVRENLYLIRPSYVEWASDPTANPEQGAP